MCQAFSCLVTEAKKVYWKAGVDSHDALWSLFKSDPQLADTPDRAMRLFAPVEITPDQSYLEPEARWMFALDCEEPSWWTEDHRSAAMRAHRQWKKEIYSKINLAEAKSPVNPFFLAAGPVTEEVLALLKAWDSVGASAWASVRASVWDSVRASVLAYIGSLFDIWPDGYPYSAGARLWRMGFVASFDGKVWRLHAGPKADIVWMGKI